MPATVKTLLSSCLLLFMAALASAPDLHAQIPAAGPLQVDARNPRYFMTPAGKTVYLTGSHTWYNLQDGNGVAFDYTAYLNLLQSNQHNFIRLWVAETPQADQWIEPAPGWNGSGPWYQRKSPMPFLRTGPGTAADGLPKFNLYQFNQAYFDRLRARVVQARDRGIYVGVMLYNFWTAWNATSFTPGRNVWRYHPYNGTNNVNGVNGDADGNGSGEETHRLQIATVLQAQEAYVRKVIDTVNDLDNVLYEISNEDSLGDISWQRHMANVIKSYESGKPKQHPIGITGWGGSDNSLLRSGPHDWVSDGAANYDSPDDPYNGDPPSADGARVSVLDTDHTGYFLFKNNPGFTRTWVWKSFTRGHNPILMEDLLGSSGWIAGRAAMGHTRAYADRLNLAATTPQSGLCSTGYCLANPGQAYLVYQPGSGAFSVNLAAGAYNYEWFNPASGAAVSTGVVGAAGGAHPFTPPFSGPAVLYVTLSAAASPPPPPPPPPGPTSATTGTKTTSGSGLVGHWRFDESAGFSAADTAGLGHTGNLVNSPAWTEGRINNGLRFDGANDYVQMDNPSGTLAPQTFTVALWVNASSFANANWNSTLLNLGAHEWINGYYGLSVTTAGNPIAMLNIGGGSSNAVYLQGPTIVAGQWQHLAMTYDSSVLKLYLNGQLAAQQSVNRIRSASAQSLILGRRGDSGYQFSGVLDEVQIFDRALAGSEILSLTSTSPSGGGSATTGTKTTAPPPPPPLPPSGTVSTTGGSAPAGLVASWSFEEGSGSVAADSSGLGHTGVLVNNPQWGSGRSVTGIRFDGVDDYVQVNNAVGALTAPTFTAALWVNPAGFANGHWNAALINSGSHEWTNGYYGLALTTAGVPIAMLNIGGGAANAVYLEGPAITSGQWHHLTMSYDGGTLRLYVDGALANQLAVNRARAGNTQPVLFGRRGDGGYYFTGTLDSVRLYNRALGAQEVSALATSP